MASESLKGKKEFEGPRFNISEGIRNFGKDSTVQNVSTGVIGGFTIGLVALPIILSAGQSANLPVEVIESWVFSVQVFGALAGIILALGYRLPIAGAWSIPGMFAIAQVMDGFTMNEAVGAFLVAGIIVLVLGLTGWINKVVQYIPQEIMDAMVAGVLFSWSAKIIPAFQNEPLIAIIGVIGYCLSVKVLRKIPPVLGTFIFGLIAVMVLNNPDFTQLEFGFAKPMLFAPTFTLQSIISIGIPLALLVICAENMQAIGVLRSNGYKVPINQMTIVSGIGGLIAPWTGGHNANIAGLMTAFTAVDDAGPKEKRYVASIWNGILFGALGVFAPLSVSLLGILPVDFINLLVGLVLLGIVIGALTSSFGSKRFHKGSFFSFMVALSGITVFGIGCAFWALVIGCLVSLILEKNDFKAFISQKDDTTVEIETVV